MIPFTRRCALPWFMMMSRNSAGSIAIGKALIDDDDDELCQCVCGIFLDTPVLSGHPPSHKKRLRLMDHSMSGRYYFHRGYKRNTDSHRIHLGIMQFVNHGMTLHTALLILRKQHTDIA